MDRPMQALRILLADDHALFRDGIASLLRAWRFDLVGEAGDGAQAVAQALALRPDVVLMDVHMPRMNGIEATRHQRGVPRREVIILGLRRRPVRPCRAGVGERPLLKTVELPSCATRHPSGPR
jgi:two-component system NarL family response regulator